MNRTEELEQYFKALGDGTRLRIVNLLLHGELCVCDIQYVLSASQPLISRHLAYLRNSKVVFDRRSGYRIYYRLAQPGEATKRVLFEFLRQAFKDQDLLRRDTKRLKAAVANGACTVSEWKPYGALRTFPSAKLGKASKT